jgi:hypothetical protein
VILEYYLWAYCNYHQDNWKQLLPIAEVCYNNTKLEITKVTLFYTNYGYHPRFEPDLGGTVMGAPEVSEYASALTRLYAELWAEITYAQRTHAEQANRVYHPDAVLELGDWVWLQWKHIKTT